VNSDRSTFPWPAQSATGVGSMPGTDMAESIAVVLGEVPELAYLPELPARGPGADMIGRTAGLLVDLPVQLTARGWQLAGRPGRDLRRARDLLAADLDALEAASDYAGCFKIQACGPWTLAAGLELHKSGEPALADEGAVADLVASLAEGLAVHAADVRRRVPGATLLVQLDEPSLPAVLAGAIPTASGLYRLSAVDDPVAADGLRSVLAAISAPTIVHCCAQDIPFSCLTGSGATAVSFDAATLRRTNEDAVGEAVEAGIGMFVGAVPTGAQVSGATPTNTGAKVSGTGSVTDISGAPLTNAGAFSANGNSPDTGSVEGAAIAAARQVIALWRRIGLPLGSMSEQVVLTPACGLAGVTPARARLALARCQSAARLIPELIEQGAP
jgi:Cobalamin-independent synthase, Catalytic domain